MRNKTGLIGRFRGWWRVHVSPWWHRFQITRWLIAGFLAIILVVSVLGTFEAKTTDVDNLKSRLRTSTIVYDASGDKAGAIAGQKGTYVGFKKISSNAIDAVLATEDRNFYKEPGFSVTGMTRGVLKTIWYRLRGINASAGGSTITQQLVKNAFLTQNQTITRKVRELFLAIQVEKVYTKHEILAMYLNNAYFGQGVWGIQDASRKYFNTNAADLTVSQAAMLAGMLQSPNGYDPLNHPEAALARRNQVLLNLVAVKKLSEADEKTLAAAPIGAADYKVDNSSYNYPYFFDAVINEAISKYGLTENEILNDGYKIYTTLNQRDQTNLQNDYDNNYLNLIGGNSQGASIILDAKTGGVRAVVGGRGEHVFRGYNRATQMRRQPGSAIKPIVSYAPSLSRGYSYDSLLKNEKTSFGTNGYSPTNHDGTETAPVPMYEALEYSYNIPAVWLLDQMGVSVGYNAAVKAGLPLTKKDKNLALALGGLDGGVSPLQLAQAYTSFANGGVMSNGYFISKITDASGHTIAEGQSTQKRLWSKSVADEMTSMMQGVFTAGTGVAGKPNGYAVAGKTGTTETNVEGASSRSNDSWVVAYTPDVVTVTWAGYDSTSTGDTLPVGLAYTTGPLVKQMLSQVIPNTAQTSFASENVETMVANDAASSSSSGSGKSGGISDAISEGAANAWSNVKQGAKSAWSNIKDLLGQ